MYFLSYFSQICQLHKPCEIDPVKLKDAENLENNRVGSSGDGEKISFSPMKMITP